MKISSEQGPIAVHGSQEAARRAEGSWTDSKAIHNIDGAEAFNNISIRERRLLRQISRSLCSYVKI
jgi:hypothetical protein